MTATLTFANYIQARAFAREWAFYSLRGYSLKGSTLELPDVTEWDQKWIDAKVADLIAKD